MVKPFFPDTPENMTIAFWVTSFQLSYPVIGGAVLNEVINGILGMISLLCVIKIWKLLPFT